MRQPIRVLQWGLGAMGSGMARLMLEKPGLEIVAAVDGRPDYVGKDLGEVLGVGKRLGVTVTDRPEDRPGQRKGGYRRPGDHLLDEGADARPAQDPHRRDQLRLHRRGDGRPRSAEPASWPRRSTPWRRQNGVSVLGTGVNPGFVLDLLVVTLTGGCHSVERIEASRVNDLSPYGPTVMKTQGVGTTPEAFAAGVADGSIVGHVGFPESIHMISEALGLGVTASSRPASRSSARSTARPRTSRSQPGMVAGCAHIGIGYRGDKEVVKLIHPQQIHPHLEDQDTGDYIHIYGKPEIHMSIKPEIAGGIATMGVAVNMIPHVVAATPGPEAHDRPAGSRRPDGRERLQPPGLNRSYQ